MFSLSSQPTSWRLDSPETIWLEDDWLDRARDESTRSGDEGQQWQLYINALAGLALEDWLRSRSPNRQILRTKLEVEGTQLSLNDWRLVAIATEQTVSEGVSVAAELLDEAEWAGQLYLLLEVDEEDESVTIRGVQRRDLLCDRAVDRGDRYWLPLDSFEPEPNRVFQYVQHLDIASIPLPQSSTDTASATVAPTARLSQWLQGMVQEGWDAIEALTTPQTTAFAVRGLADGARRGKLIDLGVQLGDTSVALVVGIAPAEEGKVSISVQLLPTGSDRTLPPDLTLTQLSKAGKPLQSVTTRLQDNFIQLKSFKGKPGQKFSLRLSLGDWQLTEDFEI